MKDRRPHPHVQADDVERNIVRPHRMPLAYPPPEMLSPPPMYPEVGRGEQDRRGLLHAPQPPERPLAVVLLHPVAPLDRLVHDGVHAGVFHVVFAAPARQPQRQREGVGRRTPGSRRGCETVLVVICTVAGRRVCRDYQK